MAAPSDSVQQAHDYLLAQTRATGGSHTCHLCSPAAANDRAREESHVAENQPETRFTEAQHLALVESAVRSETASLTTAKEELETQVASLTTEKAGLEGRLAEAETKIGVLEAEKAAAEAQAETARAEFEEYKAEQQRAAEAAARREERVSKIKAANANLAADFFTDERVDRWANMSDEAFAEVAAAFEAAANAAPKTKEQAAAAPQTAAFTGGAEAGATKSEVTTTRQFLFARRSAGQNA